SETGRESGIAQWGRRPWDLVGQFPLANDPGRPHHVKYSGGKAEQQKHNQPPWRYSQPAVEQPADQCAHDHACHQLGRHPETAGIRRRFGGRTRIGDVFGWPARIVEPLAETPEPRGESGLVVRRFLAISCASRAVSHAFDPRGFRGSACAAALKAARTILRGFVRVKKRPLHLKYLKSVMKRKIFRTVWAC